MSMIKVEEKDFQSFKTGELRGSADASDLGLKPGEWPEKIESPFGDLMLHHIFRDGAHFYAKPFTHIGFTIWND